MNTAPQLEIMPEVEKDLRLVIQQNNLLDETAKNLSESFAPFFRNAKSVIEKSRGITVTDASQRLEIKLARECRLELRSIRVESDKTRKALGEESLRKKRAIDGFHAILVHLTDSEETRLREQEEFVERQEAEKKAKLKADREAALAPYGIDVTFISLGEMSDEAWGQLLENTQAAHTAKLEAARKAEEERIRLDNERLKEEARIREENAKLKREAEEREAAAKVERERVAKEKAEAEAEARRQQELALAKLRAEREAFIAQRKKEQEEAFAAAEKVRKESEAKAKAEREAREKAEAELATARAEKARQEKEAKEAEELRAFQQAEVDRKAALAPDRERLRAYIAAIRALQVPNLNSGAGVEVAVDLKARLAAFLAYCERKANTL
jgi:hypothetical protein